MARLDNIAERLIEELKIATNTFHNFAFLLLWYDA